MRSLALTFALLGSGLVALGCGDNGKTSAGSGGAGASGSGGGGAGGEGGAGSTTLSLPQFVRLRAYIDTAAFTTIPIVVATSGDVPDAVDVTVGNATVHATKTSQGFLATVPSSALVDSGDGVPAANVLASASIGGHIVARASSALLYFGAGSSQFTKFAAVGPAYASTLFHDVKGDALDYSWVSVAGSKHGLWFNELDGAFGRLLKKDIALGDPKDEPLDGHTVYSGDQIGVVYRTQKPNDGHWLVKMRVVDHAGKPSVDTIDLTQGQAAFTPTQAGVDPGGFSAAWLHISPPNPNPPPVEVRFARWDTANKKLVGPITLDMDQPDASSDGQGPQTLEPLGELGIACNTDVCLVTYTRDVYNGLVDLNIPKLFVAVIDLKTGKLTAKPKPVEANDWDTQLFGHHVIALADGTFQLVYTANDTQAAVNPKSPCDNMLERDLLFAVKIDAKGNVLGTPQPIFDFQGSREYPRIAAHPAGFALFWEDQRSECGANGHLRMAFDVTDPTLAKLLDPYLEVPGSIGLPPEDPSLAVAGSNFVVAWSDNRDGMGILDSKSELFFDTYWRK